MSDQFVTTYNRIFKEFQELKQEKEVKIWEMGTDFILHVQRWGYFINKIFERENIKSSDQVIDLDFKYVKVANTDDGNARYAIEVNINYRLDKTSDIERSGFFLSFGKGSTSDKLKFFEVDVTDVDKLYAKSTFRQLIETWCSVGFSSPLTKFDSNFWFSASNVDPTTISEIEALKEIVDNTKRTWDYRSIRSNSIRDIAITLSMAYDFTNDQIVDVDSLRQAIGNSKLKFRGGKIVRTVDQVIDAFVKTSSSFKKQTNIKKFRDEFKELFDELRSFIYNKAIDGWEVHKDSSENAHLLYYNNKQNRSGQSSYRLSMANSIKRNFTNGQVQLHDIQEGIEELSLVDAAHILDYKLCSDEEKYDTENGLFLDPSFHKWFDKDILTFDTEGSIFIKKEYVDQVIDIISVEPNSKIREGVLTPKTKYYISRRLETRAIDLDDYIIY